jgi:hypothetical protein
MHGRGGKKARQRKRASAARASRQRAGSRRTSSAVTKAAIMGPLLLSAGTGQAATEHAASPPRAGTYRCVPAPANAPTPPPLPPTATHDRAAAGLTNAPPLCPNGEVAIPRGYFGPKQHLDVTRTTHQRVLPGRGTPPIPTLINGDYCPSYGSGVWYCHDIEHESNVSATGMLTSMGQYQPSVGSGDSGGHSISQLWAMQGSGSSLATVETGWSVGPGQWGDSYPHLFEYHTGDGYKTNGTHDCYDACGFVGASGSPVTVGERLPTDGSYAAFGTELSNSNWWLYYGGYWYGYIPVSDSNWLGNPLTAIANAEVGGEVSSGVGQCPHTQMGNGTWGHKNNSDAYAFTALDHNGSYSSLVPDYYAEEGTKLYDIGGEQPALGTFHYGGPGC